MNYLKKLFSGRITRLEYLVGGLINSLATYLISSFNHSFPGNWIYILIIIMFDVILGIFGVSLVVRRYHDINKSGWSFLLLFIPIVNLVFALILYFKAGNPKTNKYGNPPKGNNLFIQEIFQAT